MVKPFTLEECPHTLVGSRSLDHRWLPFPQNGSQSFNHGERIVVLHKLLGKPDLLCDEEVIAFEQVDPGSIRADQLLKLVENGHHHRPVLLSASDAGHHSIDCGQTSCSILGLVKDDQQYAQAENQVCGGTEARWKVDIHRRPIQMQKQQADTQQPGTDFPSCPTKTQ